MVGAYKRHNGVSKSIGRNIRLPPNCHIADARRFDQRHALAQIARKGYPARMGNHPAAKRVIVVRAIAVIPVSGGDFAPGTLIVQIDVSRDTFIAGVVAFLHVPVQRTVRKRRTAQPQAMGRVARPAAVQVVVSRYIRAKRHAHRKRYHIIAGRRAIAVLACALHISAVGVVNEVRNATQGIAIAHPQRLHT